MIDTSIFWLRAAACFYAAGLLHSMLSVVRRSQTLYPFALGTFRIGVVLHAVALVELAMAYGRLPIDNFYGTLNLCAFLIALAFLFVEARFQGTAVAMFPLVFLMTFIAALERPVATWPNVGVRDAWLIVHIILVLAGYAALFLTATASVFYLIQERRLKHKRPTTLGLLEKLPPLATLDHLISASMNLGFVLLTLGVIFAIAWASTESATHWIGDPKIILSFFTWALCLLMIVLRASAGWRGRKAAVMALTVLGCSALTWAAHIGLRPVLAP